MDTNTSGSPRAPPPLPPALEVLLGWVEDIGIIQYVGGSWLGLDDGTFFFKKITLCKVENEKIKRKKTKTFYEYLVV